MVILYVEIQSRADETIYFKNPLARATKISLISCSFYNNMNNLIVGGKISDSKDNVLIRIPQGNYTEASFKTAFDEAVPLGDKKVTITKSGNRYYITPTEEVKLNYILAKLLNVDTTLAKDSKTIIKIIQPPNVIYIHCDLIDSMQVLYKANYSQILSSIELDKVGEKVIYNPNNTLCVPISVDYICNIRLWAAYSGGITINNGIYPIRMVIEII